MFENQSVEKTKVMKGIGLFLLVLSVFFVVKIIGEIRGLKYVGSSDSSIHTITISGKGEVSAVPDIATISFTIDEKAKTVKDAQDTATKKVNDAIDFLEKSGIEKKDIKTEGYNTYPDYQYTQIECIRYPCPTGSPTIIGYHVSQSISVKVRDTSITGEILQGLGNINVTNISGPNFEIDNQDALEAQARKEAIDDAKTKAKSLARDLGVRLGRIVSFEESGGGYPIYYAKAESLSMDSGGTSAPQVPTGENKITSNITISYEIK